MSRLEPEQAAGRAKGQWFSSTHWTTVLTACDRESSQASAALEEVCRRYWYPLYAYVRRRGHSPHDAQDLTQGFFAQLLETDYLAQVDRQKGKFRSFLLAALNHFLLDTRKRENAAKRGSGQTPLSLDEATAEDRYALESQDEMSPERIYERRWALTVLDHVLSRLENEFAAARKSEQFEQLRPFLLGGTESQPYSKVAERLGMDEGAVRTAVHRMRRRYGELLQEEIAHTVASPDEIEGELTYLINALGS